MAKLVLLRHGESTANYANVYTGWNDVELTEKGRKQAENAGQLIKQIPNFNPTHLHTSVLLRAIVTANIVAEVCGWLYLPITKTWRLNERHYGKLRGINKDQSREIFGDEQITEWRRGFYAVPPEGGEVTAACYASCDRHRLPRAESLYQTQKRLMPYYHDQIASRLRLGEDQLVVAHGSSLRALIKKLEEIDDYDIVKLEVPNAEPIIYTLDDQLNIIKKEILH